MRAYEVMYIIKVAEDEAIDAVVAKFDKLLADNGATVEKTDRWGKRKLDPGYARRVLCTC